jgi:hypothetical protein
LFLIDKYKKILVCVNCIFGNTQNIAPAKTQKWPFFSIMGIIK